MRFIRTASNCASCPLRDRPRIWSIGPDDVGKIVLIGESPGMVEELKGEPFSGPAGHYLNWGLGSAGILRHRCWIMNLIPCRPPSDDLSSPEGRSAVEHCLPGLEQELAHILGSGPAVIVPLGAEPTAALTGGATPISKARGSVTDFRGVPLLPTFHPSYLNRMTRDQGEKGKPFYKWVWIADLKKAKRIALAGWQGPSERFNLSPTLEELEAWAIARQRERSLIAVDIETTGRGAQTEIVVVGLAHTAEDGISVPFLKQGGSPYWEGAGEFFQVEKILRGLFASNPLMFQNALFDVRVLRQKGYPIPPENVKHDVMLMHHCLAGDTTIDTLDFGKIPICDLAGKRDFWVVSHDGKQLVPKRVKYCWKNVEERRLVRITFWSKNREDKNKMWIDCTEDHEFPVQDRAQKVKACDLKPGDRLFRGQTCRHMIDHEAIHHWVWRHVHGEDLKLPWQVHHLDGNHWNNHPLNLQKVTNVTHNRYHKDATYKATLQMQRNARRRLAKEIDAERAFELYYVVKLSGRETAEELGCTFDRLRALFRAKSWIMRNRSEALVQRWQKKHNCRVLSVTLMKGMHETYDLEVPGTHTFSANGVIVGNSVCPELPHDLGFIVSCYGSTPYWKSVMQESDVGILEREDGAVRTYNLRDCVVLHQCLPGLLKDLEETGTTCVYREESMPLIEPIAAMMDNGIKLDEGRLEAYAKKLKREKTALEKDLKGLADLPPAFNLSSDDDLRLLLYGVVPKKIAGVEEKMASKKRKDTKVYKELEALREIGEKTKPLAVVPKAFRGRTTGTGKLTVNEQGLLSLQRAWQNRLVALGGLTRKNDDHVREEQGIVKALQWLDLYYKYTGVDKLISTYTSFPLGPDGRVHTSFLIHGTASGRLASRSPNLQNQPKEDLGIRKCFVAEDGTMFVAADYENLEVRVLAHEAGDGPLIEAFEKGANIHDENTRVLFGIGPEHPKWKVARAAAKVFMFGGISYGGGDNEIYEKVILKAPELGLTFAQFKEAKQRFMDAHPAYTRWARDVQALAVKERRSVNHFGRVRVLLGEERDILKEALNTPIQSGAASIINRALIRIHARMQERKMTSRLLLQIHDELLVEAPLREVDQIKGILKEEMERPVRYGDRDVVFPVEIKTGPTWGEMK